MMDVNDCLFCIDQEFTTVRMVTESTDLTQKALNMEQQKLLKISKNCDLTCLYFFKGYIGKNYGKSLSKGNGRTDTKYTV